MMADMSGSDLSVEEGSRSRAADAGRSGSDGTESILKAIVQEADELVHDLDFEAVRRWKTAGDDRRAIGYLPVYVPVELITAAGMLPVGIVGGGDQLEIIRGDAYFQSYICHLPRSVVELGVSGRLDCCEGFLFPSTCDVIRNLSGVWQMLFPDRWVRYFDVPQNFDAQIGGRWLRRELRETLSDLSELAGGTVTDADLRRAIRLHDENRGHLRDLYDLRSEEPWKAPASEVYLVQRAGLVLPVEEHNRMLKRYLEAARASHRPMRDHARVVVTGAFCEQPPLGLLATLERAGCYIVDDDFLLGPRFYRGDVGNGAGGDTNGGRGEEGMAEENGTETGVNDPLDDLVGAFLHRREATSFIYTDERDKGAALAERVEARDAEGVIFCAPSFCDPALLDRPMLARSLDDRGISHISLKYSENTGQFQTLREQAGTFADSLKLWSDA